MGTIVEEATRISKRSSKSMEEERRAAEEKVMIVWISLTLYLDFLQL